MSLNTEEIIAVIAGSVAGLIVLLVVIAIILYLCIGRRRRDHRSNQKQFAHRHLTPDTSLSKNSGLQHNGDQRGHADPRMDTRLDPRLDPRVDPRLPKVGSSNLWFGAPSLYTSGPSQVYQDMKRKGPSRQQSQEQAAFQAPPQGHMVYQSNMGGRIYHSQQVVPSPYPNEYRLPRTGSYMDIYSYPYSYDPYKDMNNLDNSRAMLMEYPESSEYYMDPYREREVRRTGRKVRRANSDLTQHSTRRPKVRKQRGEAPFERENSREDSRDGAQRQSNNSQTRHRQSESGHYQSDSVTRAEVHRPKKQAPPPPTQKPKTQSTDPELTESATDSAKLRAIERERAREKEKALYVTTTHVISDYSRDNPGYIHDEQRSKDQSDLHVRTYNYEGKPTYDNKPSKYENSVIAKMAAMVETPKATLIPVNKGGGDAGKDIFSMQGTTTSSTESFHQEVTKKLEKLKETGSALDPAEGPVATSTGKNSRSSRPTSGRARRISSGVDADGNAITAEAFEFLDGYSDGEGTDFLGSGAITPTQMRDYDVTF